MRENRQVHWPQTWEEIFAGVPTAPGTEAEQQQHKTLREQGEMTEAEEGELNILFYVISPQFHPEARHRNTLDPCRCCPGGHGDEVCGYHANKTRRFKQRLSHVYRTNRPRINRMYQSSCLDEQITLSDVFGGLAGCFSIPLGGMIWLAWFSSASFLESMTYWTVVAFVTLIASVALWLEWF